MHRRGVLFYVGVCLLLNACSLGASRSDGNRFQVPKLDADRKAFLENFPLLNVSGQMKAPVVASTGQWPLGVLIYFPPSGEGGFCTVSHIASGKVVANAHCVERDLRIYNYFVVFYDVNGKKAYDQVKSLEYLGNVNSDDIAVLSLTGTTEARWHVVHPKIVPTQAAAGVLPPVVKNVTVWAFNPTQGNHRELFQQYGGPGMKFEPRTCAVSRTAPRVVGITKDAGGRELARAPIHAHAQERMHLFVDGCNKKLVKGNSGSLISETGGFSQVLGVYHWIVMPDKRYSSVAYTGNSGYAVERFPDEIQNNGMYGVGTAFEAAFANRPNLLNIFHSWTLELNELNTLD